jgi:hypothetical protein
MSRRIPGSTQRGNTSGLFANGDTSLPPPSTIAAQIVQNQAPEQGNSDPQNREIFGQLLQEYLQDAAASPATVDPEEVDLRLSAQLVTVVCKAGLDVLLEDNPFVGEVLVSQAIDSLSVVQLTVKKSPDLLFYTEKLDPGADEKPLLVWLLPKLLALVGQPKLEDVQGSLERLLSTFLRRLAEPTESWNQALRLVELYRACITDVTKAIESITNEPISVEIPSADAISKLWSPGNHLITIPRDCQLKVNNPQHALSIALMLTGAMDHLEESDRPKRGGILKPTLHNCTIWELDTLRRLWRSFYIRGQRPQDHKSIEGLSKLLSRMSGIVQYILQTRQQSRNRAIMLFLNAHADLLRLAVLRPDEDTVLNMVSQSLLDLDESPFFGYTLRQYVEEMLQAQVYQICSSDEQFEKIARNDLSVSAPIKVEDMMPNLFSLYFASFFSDGIWWRSLVWRCKFGLESWLPELSNLETTPYRNAFEPLQGLPWHHRRAPNGRRSDEGLESPHSKRTRASSLKRSCSLVACEDG